MVADPATGTAGARTPDYTEFETFTLVRPARTGQIGHAAEPFLGHDMIVVSDWVASR